jgi:hypothetical protein
LVSGGLRIVIKFEREELLVKRPLTDPVSGAQVQVPFRAEDSATHHVGVNIQDIVTKKVIVPEPGSGPKATARKVRTVRPDPEFFQPREHRVESPKPETFLTAEFLTGGAYVSDEGDVIRVRKKSTVSISTVAFKLAIAMKSGYEEARNWIADLAAEAWEKDVERAKQLYHLVESSPDRRIDEDLIPAGLKATATISQEIEAKLLKSACLWFGVDPEAPLPKARPGKRAKRRTKGFTQDGGETVEEDSTAGKIIILTLRGESLRGALIKDFHGLKNGTDLNALSMLSLVELLGALKEESLEVDAELLEAYLNSSWPSWQERVGATAGEAAPQNDDPWEVLGVARGASKDEIKRAYHRTMMRVHPDQSGLSSYFSILASNAYKKLIAEGI